MWEPSSLNSTNTTAYHSNKSHVTSPHTSTGASLEGGGGGAGASLEEEGGGRGIIGGGGGGAGASLEEEEGMGGPFPGFPVTIMKLINKV